MTRIEKLIISGYKSVRDEITISLPQETSLVFLGENNAGKSNIVQALNLICGEFHPRYHSVEDNEFWARDPANAPIQIRVELSGDNCIDSRGRLVRAFHWIHSQAQNEDNPQYYAVTDNGNNPFVTNEMRDGCISIMVNANRGLSYQLSYSTKGTLLSKLMRRFHKHLIEDNDRVARLKRVFEGTKDIFKEVAEFASFESELATQFQDMFAGMSYGLNIDFSAYDPSRFFHSLRLLPKEGDEIRTFDEMGTGQEQLLALAFAQAYARAFHGGIILIIEEPEAHLHPLAQQWLAKKIGQMARDGLQIVLTTHSPAFINILNLEGIVLVRKINGATKVKQLSASELAEYCINYGADSNRTDVETIQPFYASSATQEILNGLFAKKVVLVEGITESMAIPVYLEKVGLDVNKEGIAIIPVLGKGNLAKWWRFFTAYGIPTFVTFDNDDENDQEAEKRLDILKTIGIDIEVIESAVSTENWDIKDNYCVFGKDFEDTMMCFFGDYTRLENEARAIFGESKPIIAREVANRLQYNPEELGWTFFTTLKGKIENIGGLNT